MTGPSGWKRLAARLLLDCPPWLRVFADDVELPDGRRVDGFLRVEGRPYAMAFAVTADGVVPFAQQYKDGLGGVALQLPAGYLEEGEEPEACARRELLEETGYAAERWEALGSLAGDGNRGFNRGYFFLARGARLQRPPAPNDLGELRVELTPLAAVERLLGSGQIGELSPVACAALALARLREGTERPGTQATDGGAGAP